MGALNVIGLTGLREMAAAQQRAEGFREEKAREHLPQIRFIARAVATRYRPDVDLDDLVSAGYIGLLDALEKFDSSKGILFKTYAEFRIRGAILDRLRSLDPVPKWLRQKGKEIEKAYLRLEHRLGRSVTQDEVASEMGISFGELQNLLSRLRSRNVSLVEGREEQEEGVSENQLFSELPSPFEAYHHKQVRQILETGIRKLPAREQRVLKLRYREELSMKEIGLILNVHQSRVSQLHNKAVRSLRRLLPGDLDFGLPSPA